MWMVITLTLEVIPLPCHALQAMRKDLAWISDFCLKGNLKEKIRIAGIIRRSCLFFNRFPHL